MLAVAIIIGVLVGIYGVYLVVFIYKYKGTPKADLVRVLGVSSVALVVSLGLYLLQHVFWDGTELGLDISAAFTISLITSLVVFFWINRNKIG